MKLLLKVQRLHSHLTGKNYTEKRSWSTYCSWVVSKPFTYYLLTCLIVYFLTWSLTYSPD